jgi:anti-sigma factor RsiW
MGEHVSCQDVVELVTDYVEGALAAEESSLFEQHLNFCDGCVTYVDQMRATVAVVGMVRVDDVPPQTRDRLLAAFRHWRRP